MVRLDDEDIRFGSPNFLDGFVGCFEPYSLDFPGEIMGDEPVADMPP
jgi:hypothetical protein